MILGFLLRMPYILIASFIIYIPICFYIKLRLKICFFAYHMVRYLFISYIVTLIYLTVLLYYPFITFNPEHYFFNIRPLNWLIENGAFEMKRIIFQLMANVGMFIPYGLFLPILRDKHHKPQEILPIVLLSSIGIEGIQYFMGRSADIDDVITNFLGGALGYIFYRIFERLCENKKWWNHMKGYSSE